jgi:redox-sensing transcriptional repressor
LDVILPPRCQLERQIAIGHHVPSSKRLAEVGNQNFSSYACPAAAGRLILRAVKKSERPEIPRKTIYRLSIYLRCLARLHENGIGTVSSEALAKAAGVKSTQLRKDLAYFGTFGTRGLGYEVAELYKKIADELGTSRLQPVILVGVGNLGLALLSYRGFEKEGFEIVAAFDAEPKRRRDKEIKQPIHSMEKLPEFVRQHRVKMAILTVPVAVVQEVTNGLVRAGITGILNFAPIMLDVPEEVSVNNVNLAIELENLSYFIQE